MDSARPLLFGSREREVSLLRRSVDVGVVLLATPIVLAVVLALVAVVKLDSPGPAFYRNARLGAGGRRFGMWKLRTMVADAEARKEEIGPYCAIRFKKVALGLLDKVHIVFLSECMFWVRESILTTKSTKNTKKS